MDPREAGRALASALKTPRGPLTIADASAASGLALRDADRGLHWLTSEYRGHLRVTDAGDLLFLFPYGFAKPWETRDKVDRFFARLGGAAVGIGRFVVRAWVMVVLVAYVAIFLAVIVGLAFAQNDRNRRGGFPGGALVYVLLRVLGDALFWTFHPFSPFYVGYNNYGYNRGRFGQQSRAPKDETPFYEKVNRFFFGPTPPKEDPRAMEQKILAELRAGKGRIGLADVMRATGLPREQADPLMARLMLDYDGDVAVSEDGGIFYHFESMRKTGEAAPYRVAGDAPTSRPRAAWEDLKRMLPLTGNTGGSNALIVALNLFNLLMSLFAVSNDLTVERLIWIFHHAPLEVMPPGSTAIALGIVPLVFSIALFALPLGRAIARPFKARKVAKENGRLALLREILTRIENKAPLTDEALVEAWTKAAGAPPESKELTKRIVELGGDVEINEGTKDVRYRFVDLEMEAAALEAEREAASDEEKKVGKVVFASDN
jgi:hypothetical protein